MADKIMFGDTIDPETGHYRRCEMKDVSSDLDLSLGIQTNPILNFLLFNNCSNPSSEYEGYELYDFEGCCVTYRITAKYIPGDNDEMGTYDIKAVYIV